MRGKKTSEKKPLLKPPIQYLDRGSGECGVEFGQQGVPGRGTDQITLLGIVSLGGVVAPSRDVNAEG